jgi:hypothetical protein
VGHGSPGLKGGCRAAWRAAPPFRSHRNKGIPPPTPTHPHTPKRPPLTSPHTLCSSRGASSPSQVRHSSASSWSSGSKGSRKVCTGGRADASVHEWGGRGIRAGSFVGGQLVDVQGGGIGACLSKDPCLGSVREQVAWGGAPRCASSPQQQPLPPSKGQPRSRRGQPPAGAPWPRSRPPPPRAG